MKPIPDQTDALIEELDEMYPPRCFQPDQETIEQHLIFTGWRRMIDYLKEWRTATERKDKRTNVSST